VRDPQNFVTAIEEIVDAFGYELAFGVGDAEVMQLSANRRHLGSIVPYAPHHQVTRAFDKLDLTDVARKVGLSAPHTRVASEGSVSEFDLPLIVKARLHWDPDSPGTADRVQAQIAQTRQEAVEAAVRMRAMGAEPVFQEYRRGRVLHVVVVTNGEHRILTAVAHLTTRLGTSETGQSARTITMPLEPDLGNRVQAFLTAIQWFGLADLQFWVSNDNEPVLTDFNGRIYGGLALPYASGMRLLPTGAATQSSAQLMTGLCRHQTERTLVW
jgi:predicted ATP-grasp superfamily ATP-dependent carboligase